MFQIAQILQRFTQLPNVQPQLSEVETKTLELVQSPKPLGQLQDELTLAGHCLNYGELKTVIRDLMEHGLMTWEFDDAANCLIYKAVN